MSGGRTGGFQEDPSTGRIIVPNGIVDAIAGNEYGALGASIVRDYIGDGVNNREIDLGDNYDLVLVLQRGAFGAGDNHLALAIALGDTYNVFRNIGAATDVDNMAGSSGDTVFQGKMSGGDANKIKLGSDATLPYGTNGSALLYRVLGFKFFEQRS